METPETNSPDPLDAARKAITHADSIAQQDRAAYQAAVAEFDQAIAMLAAPELEASKKRRHLQGWAEMGKANALVNSDTREGIERGLVGYQAAIAHFEKIEEPEPSHRADIAAALGNIGHAQTRLGQEENIKAARVSFRRSLEILETLPWQKELRYQHQLAATWLNLGNNLARSANPTKPEPSTIEAFEKGLRFIEETPSTEIEVAALRAGLNSGLGRALMWSSDSEQLKRSIDCFEASIKTIGEVPERERQSPRFLLEAASAHANRANLLTRADVTKESIQETLKSAEIALRFSSTSEQDHLLAAEVSLSARRSICHAFGIIINNQTPEAQQQMHEKATDVLEDGLKLAQLWQRRGATGLQASTHHLFHLGCAFYCTQQPHFLPEFIMENIGEKPYDPVMLESARKILAEAMRRIQEADAADSEVAQALNKTLADLET